MSDDSDIEWTDATWNPVRGCVKVSPGCKHCYAETFAERWRGVKGNAYEQGFDPRLVPEKLDVPLRWQRPRRIFVNSMSDLFGEFVPDEYIAAMFGVMAATPQHTYQVLTKRAERMLAWFRGIGDAGWAERVCGAAAAKLIPVGAPDNSWPDNTWPLPNVHLGVSVENRKHGVPRIEHLRKTPAAVRFLSVEPLLEDLGTIDLTGIHWVIVGGESGPRARPCHVAWIRRVVEQCRTQGVRVFCKQLGAYVVDRNDAGFLGGPDDAWDVHPEAVGHDLDGTRDGYQGAPVRVHLASKKGGDPSEWPADLRVREMPQGVSNG